MLLVKLRLNVTNSRCVTSLKIRDYGAEMRLADEFLTSGELRFLVFYMFLL